MTSPVWSIAELARSVDRLCVSLPTVPMEPAVLDICHSGRTDGALNLRVCAPRAPAADDLEVVAPARALPGVPVELEVLPRPSYPFALGVVEHGVALVSSCVPASGRRLCRIVVHTGLQPLPLGSTIVVESITLFGRPVLPAPLSIPVGACHEPAGAGRLWTAARDGRENEVRRALIAGCSTEETDFGLTALAVAASKGYARVVKELLGAGASVHVVGNIDGEEVRFCTALCEATEGGHTNVVRILLEDPRVDPNETYLDGYTPLRNAAINGHEHTVAFLISDPRVDVTAKHPDGRTALDMAREYGHTVIIQLLEGRLAGEVVALPADLASRMSEWH